MDKQGKHITSLLNRMTRLENIRESLTNHERVVDDAIQKIRKQHGNTIENGFYHVNVCYCKFCDFQEIYS